MKLQSRVSFILWAMLSPVLITTGPFGTYAAFGFAERMLFWLPVLAGALAIGILLQRITERLLPGIGPGVTTLVTTALACAVNGPILFALIGLIAPRGSANHPSFVEILLLAASLALGQRALQATGRVVEPAVAVPEPPPEAKPPRSRLLQRIEPQGQGDLLSISVRDHYVDVQTSVGATSLLMRLADAIAEADPVEGAQVHRSHWVAWAAVEAVEREAGKVHLRLSHGGRVPVSKNHRGKLEERGLL